MELEQTEESQKKVREIMRAHLLIREFDKLIDAEEKLGRSIFDLCFDLDEDEDASKQFDKMLKESEDRQQRMEGILDYLDTYLKANGVHVMKREPAGEWEH